MAASDDELAHTATAPPGTSARPLAPALGETLGRYRLEKMLGEGGMGVVHAAFDPDLERRVALKVLRTDGGGEARQRLLREARAMARLTHANVVTVHEVGTAGDRDYVAMELIDGETLADWLVTKPSPDEAIAAFVAAGRGVAAAHAAGLVHRDFKPHNVLRRRDGRIVVTDFGLARGVENSPPVALDTTLKVGTKAAAGTPSSLSGLTATGSVLGTPAYMAPEQWTGGTVGPAADQFAFCVALWEALTGERPFRGDSIEALKEEVNRGPADLDASKLPRRLRRTLVRGLDPDPARRWPSMDALLTALVRADRRPKLVLGAAGGAVVAAGIAFFVLHGSEPPSCTAPQLDPNRVWSGTIAATTPKELADVFSGNVTRWTLARATACTADPAERPPQLRCLDGALARLDAIRQGMAKVPGITEEDVLVNVVDPSICLGPAPPRLALDASADVIDAFALYARTAPEKNNPPAKEIQAFADRPGLAPCARVIALLALAATDSGDFATKRAAINEGTASIDTCEDDRVRADMLFAAVPYQFELPVIGPKGQAAIKRADAAIARVAQPDLSARLDFTRGYVLSQQEHWKESFELVERAIDTLEQAGLHHRALDSVVEAIEIRFTRSEVADLDAVRAMVAKWKPIAERMKEAKLLTWLERDDALARYALGDVAAAHAELVRLWKPSETSDVRGERTQRIEGDIVDRDGKPVVGATVVAGRRVVGDSIGVPLPMFRLHLGDGGLRVTKTDAAGHFVIADAPEKGAVVAQLGDRRSRAAPIAERVKLAVVPTRRLAGKVVLGKMQYTETLVVVEDPSDHSNAYSLVAPVAADGTFSIDGAPAGKVNIAVAADNHLFGTQLQYKPIAASVEPVTGIELSMPTTGRELDVLVRSTVNAPLDTAQVVIVPGRVHFTNVGELIAHFDSGVATAFAQHVVGEKIPQIAIDKIRPGDLLAHFGNVPPGEVTACGIGISGDLMDRAEMQRMQNHVKELEIRCETISGDTKIVVVSAPPQKRFE